jgi:hypothetical protein
MERAIAGNGAWSIFGANRQILQDRRHELKSFFGWQAPGRKSCVIGPNSVSYNVSVPIETRLKQD